MISLKFIALAFCLFCPSFAGYACLSNPCIYGICIDDINSTYSCYCIDGYTGIQCQTNWNECWSSPCKNGGSCIDGIASYNCSCPDGFVGNECEINYNECSSNPCLNNGTCIDADNGYNCTCLPGFSGTYCEVDVAVCNATNEARCENGGFCIEGPGFTFYCKCLPGWTGKLCAVPIDECESSPCQNGGVCIDSIADYSCACHFGYTGKNCEEEIIECSTSPCKNEALCLMEDDETVCYCVPDFHGDRCQYQYDECQLGPRCLNGGTCIDGVDTFSCSCPEDLTGVLCECLILPNGEYDCTYIRSIYSTTTTELLPVTISTSTLMTIKPKTSYPPESSSQSTIIFTTVPNETSTLPIFTTDFQTTPEEGFTTIFITTVEDTKFSTITSSETTSSIFENVTQTTFLLTSEEGSTIQMSPRIDDLPTNIPETTVETKITSTEDLRTTWESTSEDDVEMTETITKVYSETTSYENQTTSEDVFTTFFTEFPSSTFESTTDYSFTTSFLMESTTVVPANISKEIDCQVNPCRNGGTCVITTEGHRCICTFDTEGHLCEIQLGITNAAFSGDSYLSHRIYDRNHMNIGLKAKTLSSSGIIFYSNLGKNAYMTLYLMDGMIKFQFSCGLQTMVLSELDVAVNNGYLMDVQANIEYAKNYSHCNATIKLNDTLSMSGDQSAYYKVFDKTKSWIHFGGIPQQYLHTQPPISTGFMGCINSLKVNGMSRAIFKEARDGFEVTECDSLACLSSPCYNGASCVEKGDKWSCLCRNGYVGDMCEHSVCNNNPCLFGATCVPYTGGFICLCPFGKHGHLCEQDLEIGEPSFSSSVNGLSSFAAYSLTKPVSYSLEMSFKFTLNTIDQIALLMFIGQDGFHDSTSDHISISFVKGYIMLTWNLGGGPRRIFTGKPINTQLVKEHVVRFGRFGRRAWLAVDNLGNVTGRSPGKLAQLDVNPVVYLGGHYASNFSILPHDLPLHSGFSGCIYDVDVKADRYLMPLDTTKAAFGRSVAQCGTAECSEYVCQNGGACLQHGSSFTCLCADGWFGQYCTIKFNPCDSMRHNCSFGSTCVPLIDGYECDCPTGSTGQFCEKRETLSDVSFIGKRSYLKIKTVEIQDTYFNIDLQIRPLGDRGLILFAGNLDASHFMSLYLQGGILQFRIYIASGTWNGNELTLIRSGQVLRIGEWHQIRFGKYGKRVYLWTDGLVSTGMIKTERVLTFPNPLILSLGGLEDLSELPKDASSSYPVPYTGCIRQLFINDHHIQLNATNVMESRNIADCDGTPCGGDICLNGGSCWLDSNIQPHCSCREQYTGESCQERVSCLELACKNHGKCVPANENEIDGHVCHCPVGWTGDFCEINAQPVRAPFFTGDNSYLAIEAQKTGMKRNAGIQEREWMGISYVYLNFSTAKPDGMILWSDNKDEFLGIGIEQGTLKLAWAWKNTNTFIVEVPSVGQIADGGWHDLLITFNTTLVSLWIDGKSVHSQSNLEEKIVDQVALTTNGIFFLADFPSGKSMFVETKGLFSKPFSGCIREVGFFENEHISDFSDYSGENVDLCDNFKM